MALTKGMSEDQQRRLTSLFYAYDVDNSGYIEKNEFFTICQELQVTSQEADRIFNRLDVDKDGTVTLEEFISGFRELNLDNKDGAESDDNDSKSEGEDSYNEELTTSR